MDNDNSIDFAKMMEMAQLFNSFMGQPSGSSPIPSSTDTLADSLTSKGVSDSISNYNPVEFDAAVQTDALKTIKAAIPHLEPRYRQNMSVLVKLIEIRKLLRFYGEGAIAAQAATDGDWRINMLTSIRPYMPDHKQYTLDMLVKFIDLQLISQKMRALGGIKAETGAGTGGSL